MDVFRHVKALKSTFFMVGFCQLQKTIRQRCCVADTQGFRWIKYIVILVLLRRSVLKVLRCLVRNLRVQKNVMPCAESMRMGIICMALVTDSMFFVVFNKIC